MKTSIAIKTVCNEIEQLLLTKNRKYGDSALHPENTFSNVDAYEAINVRIDDKIRRIKNSNVDEDEDLELDLIGYLILRRVYRLVNSSQEISTNGARIGTINADEELDETKFTSGIMRDFTKVL